MSAVAPSIPYTATVYSTVEDAERVAAAFVRRGQPVYFDTKTCGLDPRTKKIVAIQLKQAERPSVVFDVRDRPEVVRALRPIFEECYVAGHNLKFDLNFLHQHGIRAHKVYDTQIAEQLLHGVGLGEAADRGHPVNLEATAKRYGIAVNKEERSWFIDLDQRSEWSEPFPPEQVAYMAQDTEVLPTIAVEQKKKLLALGLMQVCRIEMRCLLALVEMESAGIRIDVEGWRAFIAEKDAEAKRLGNEVLAVIGEAIQRKRIEDYDREMRRYENWRAAIKRQEQALREEFDYVSKDGVDALGGSWGAFKTEEMKKWRARQSPVTKPKLDMTPPNLNSTDQLIVGLEALGVPVPLKKNDKGARVKTTESKSLEPLSARYPAIKLFLAYRKNAKFVTSFGETLLAHVGADGRIHPEYQQIGAATGRMSCARPNWQQVPSKGDGKRLRELVKATPGCAMLTADFSNIELRILANMTGDKTMVRLFNEGADLHSATAKRMFKLADEIDPAKVVWKRDLTYRQIAKIINFMLVYGGTPFKLAMEIGIEVDEAESLVESYFKAYPGVKGWMDAQRKAVWTNLYSTTLAGRRRPYKDVGPEPSFYGYGKARAREFDEAHREWEKRRRRVERQAMNLAIQGSSADITKLACAIFVENCAPEIGRLVATVHDELVVEAREDSAVLVSLILKDAMKQACDRYLKLSPVPEPDVSIEDHWSKG